MVAGGRAIEPPLVRQLEDDRSAVGCGRTIADQQVVIVDPPDEAPCAPGSRRDLGRGRASPRATGASQS